MRRQRSPFWSWSLLFVLWVAAAGKALGQEEDVEKWFDRAEIASGRGQWSRAANFYRRVVQARADDDEAARRLAVSLEAIGAYEELQQLSAARMEQKPADDFWFDAQIDVLKATGRLDELRRVANRRLDSGRTDLRALAAIGEAEAATGRREEAEKVFDRIIERSKAEVIKEARDLTALARAYLFWPHGLKPAEKVLAEAQKADPSYLPAYEAIAEVYERLELPADMEHELKDALEIRKEWPSLLVLQARAAELRMGQAEARRDDSIRRALVVNPNLPGALFFRGMDELSDANWDKARATFEAGLAVDPGHLECLSGRAALSFLLHETDDWQKLEARVLAIRSDFGGLYRITARAASERRRWDESLELMRRATEVEPALAANWDDRARYALYLGHEEEGIEALKRANDAAPSGQPWRNNMSLVMAELAKNYETVTTDHYVLKLHESQAKVMKRFFPEFIERSFAEFAARYGDAPKRPVVFEVLRAHADFSVRTMGTNGLGALGVCFGPTVIMDSPSAQKAGSYNWSSTAHHELSHVFSLLISRGRTPRWLTEGLSSWEEVRRDPSAGRNLEIQLHDALMNDELLGVMDFDAAFRTSRIIFAYFQGEQVCRWIEEKWGVGKIVEMLRLYGEDRQTPEVLRRVFDLSPEEFDAGFRAAVTDRLKDLRRIPNWSEKKIEAFRAAVAAGEDVDENSIRLAWGLFRAGKEIDADAALKPLLDRGVSDPRIPLLLGMRALRGRARDRARAEFEKVLAAGYEDHDLYVEMAKLAARSDDETEKVKEWWTKASRTNPFAAGTRDNPVLELAKILKAEGDLDGWARETRTFCDRVDIAVPQRAELADWHLAAGRKKEALLLLDEIMRVLPFDPDFNLERGDLEEGTGALESAAASYESAIDLGVQGPKEFKARIGLGRIFLALDRQDDASYHLTRAVELDPDSTEAKSLLDRCRK